MWFVVNSSSNLPRQRSHVFTAVAAQNMDVVAVVGALEHSADKVVVKTKFKAADGAASWDLVVKTGITAADVH